MKAAGWWIAAATLVGAGLRLWRINEIGISHFDEGQYAFARVWPWIDGFDLDQAFFSPPLFPFLVGLVHWLGAPPASAGIYVACAFGIGTIPLAGAFARALFGPRAGVGAAWLVAVDPMLVAFSRAGLTDAPFAFFVLATLLLFRTALVRNSLSMTFVSALFAWFTWNAKYNGFLVLAVAFAWTLAPNFVPRLKLWAVAATLAAAGMLPWYLTIHLAHPQGIDGLRQHQAGYVRGWSAVPGGFKTAYESRKAVIADMRGTAFVALVAAGVVYAPTRLAFLNAALFTMADVGGGACFTIGPVLGIFALWRKPLADWFVIGLAVFAFFVLPGIYTPYLRLWTVAEVFVALLMGAGLFSIQSSRPLKLYFMPLFTGALAMGFLMLPSQGRRFDPETRAGYRLAVGSLAANFKNLEVSKLLVYVRPPAVLELALHRLNLALWRLPDSADALPARLAGGEYLIVDAALRDSKKLAPELERRVKAGAYREVARFAVEPSRITVLDDFPPPAKAPENAYDLIVYGPGE